MMALPVHTVTAGNPFLLHELAREIAADGSATGGAAAAERIANRAPRSITRATMMRMQRLGRGATELAFAVAVVGTGAPLCHAAAIAGLGLEAAGEAADALARVGILAAKRPLGFVHPSCGA